MSRRIIVVGASAGGVEALTRLVQGFPADLGVPVAVVLHTAARWPSGLPAILTRAGPLEASHPEDGDPIEPGRVHVAPPDRHLLVADGRFKVARGPRENGHRPAIDPLFRSAATSFGPGAIALVLSGTRDDGAAGAAAIASAGGRVVVQDPADAIYPSMPENAIAADHPDYVAPVGELAAIIARIVAEPVPDSPAAATEMEQTEVEEHYADLGNGRGEPREPPGEPAPFGCPACGGVLWEAEDEPLRFRCRVGHAFGAESLLDAESQTIEDALWTALRALEERSELSRRIARRLRDSEVRGADRYERQASVSASHAKVLREVLTGRSGGSAGE